MDRLAPRRQRLFRLGLAVVLLLGLAVAIAIGEGVARYFGLGTPVRYVENLSYRYALAPDQAVTRLRGARIVVDRYGFRTNDDWDGEGKRVLFVGDSVTYGGAYIDNDELFSMQACERLRQAGRTVVCANAGTNGYGTDNMAFRIRFDRAPRADVYVVTLISQDTLRGTAKLDSFPYFSRPLPPLVPALAELVLFGLDGLRARMRFEGTTDLSDEDKADRVAVARMSLQRLFDALEEVQRDGAEVLIVLSPVQRAVDQSYGAFDRIVLRELERSGFPVLDMREEIVTRAPELTDFHYDGVHLDVAGHAFYGKALADRLGPVLD